MPITLDEYGIYSFLSHFCGDCSVTLPQPQLHLISIHFCNLLSHPGWTENQNQLTFISLKNYHINMWNRLLLSFDLPKFKIIQTQQTVTECKRKQNKQYSILTFYIHFWICVQMILSATKKCQRPWIPFVWGHFSAN